ncbi:hypothetical protein [Magnetococcus sp. PR-3]|uniref:hypothetical protein n=1 Tax=Magnetococcus sp. PR-3 TaxID=3120355 RepID=UPI002FCE45D1
MSGALVPFRSYLCVLLIAAASLLLPLSIAQAQQTISPSEVFREALQIEKELELLLEHFDIQENKNATHRFKVDLEPRHVWQKSYFILVKLNVFRAKNGLPRVPPNAMQPVQKLDPVLVYEQTQRILTEIAIIKTRLGIEIKTSKPEPVTGKKPIDVFNKLHGISLKMEILNDAPISPSLVFSEVMRIYEDSNSILRRLQLEDPTFPPAKMESVTPQNSLEAAFELLKEIQRLQRDLSIPRTDFSPFMKWDEIIPADVFNMVGMSLAELQTIKTALELNNTVTPQAKVYTGKKPADVHQLLRWITRKVRLIQSLR